MAGFYIGRVGNLIALPEMGPGVVRSTSWQGGTHRSLGGARWNDRVGASKDTWQIAQDALTAEELSVFEAFAHGAYGPGPFVFLDPSRRNLLTPNQSSGTDVLRNATGFQSFVNGVASTAPTSSAAQFVTGGRSLRLTVAVGAAGSHQTLTGPGGFDVPDTTADPAVVPTLIYTASALMRKDVTAEALTMRFRLRWYNAAGTLLSPISDGTAVTIDSASWTSVTATAAAPANAAMVRLSIANGSVTTVGNGVYVDSLQFEQAAAASVWVLGTGVPRVVFENELADTQGILGQHDVSYTLVEV